MQLLADSLQGYRVERKMMFGSVAYFVNNNMFAGVHEDNVIMRLSEEDRQEILSTYHEITRFTPMGRVMKEYAALPELICADKDIFTKWLGRSYRYAASLPQKESVQKGHL